MLNRKLVEYTDISSKYVKVGVRYCVCLFFFLNFYMTSSFFFFSYLFLCILSVIMYIFPVCHRSLRPSLPLQWGGVSTLESLVLSPKLTSLFPRFHINPPYQRTTHLTYMLYHTHTLRFISTCQSAFVCITGIIFIKTCPFSYIQYFQKYYVSLVEIKK